MIHNQRHSGTKKKKGNTYSEQGKGSASGVVVGGYRAG